MTAQEDRRTVADPGRDDARSTRRPGPGWLAATFVTLADTLVDGFDVLEHLQLLADRAAEYTAAAAGILLADQRGGLQVAATTGRAAERLELFGAQTGQGPCVHTASTGRPVDCRDLPGNPTDWPGFTTRATGLGIRSVTAVPLRVREQVIGALDLFHTAAGGLDPDTYQVVAGLADVTAISVLTHRAAREGDELTRQLQAALNNRVLIEQAKGMVAQYAGISTHDALNALRGHARAHNLRLSDLATGILDGATPITEVITDPPVPSNQPGTTGRA